MDMDCFEWIEMYLGSPKAPAGSLGTMRRSFADAAHAATTEGTGFIPKFLQNGLFAAHRLRCLSHNINHFLDPLHDMFSPPWASAYLDMLGLVLVADDIIRMGLLPCSVVENEVLLLWPSAPLVNLCDCWTPMEGVCQYISETAEAYLDVLDPKSDSGYWFQDRMPVLVDRRQRLLECTPADMPDELPAPKQQYLEAQSTLDRMDRLFKRHGTAQTLVQARESGRVTPNLLGHEKPEFVETVQRAMASYGRECKAKLLYVHCQPMAYPTFLRIRRLLLNE